jgi:peptide/nickel transport system permease protein
MKSEGAILRRAMAPLPLSRVVGIARHSPTGAVGLLIILGYVALMVFAPLLAPYNPLQTFPYKLLQPPGAEFLLGTDGNGMDILSRVIYGARLAFGIAVPAVTLSLVIGVPLGLFAGFRGGLLDEILLRIMDVLRVFPSIILALAIVAATGQSLANVIFVIGFLDSPIFARVARAEVLALRSSNYIEAAVTAGNPLRRILFIHLLPNAIQGTTAQIAVRLAWAIRVSATLAFVGVGVQPPTPEWGAMIRSGAEYMITGEWWVAFFPGLALVGLVIGFNLFGDGLQQLLDPRRKTAAR